MTMYNEGDIHSEAAGTTARANRGKVLLHLVPMHLLYGCAHVLTAGLIKYAPWNWAKGGPWSSAFDSLMRHLIKWWFFDEELDDESGLHHLDHAMCNLLFLIHYRDAYKAGDDRPKNNLTHFQMSRLSFNSSFTLFEEEKKFFDEGGDEFSDEGLDDEGRECK